MKRFVSGLIVGILLVLSITAYAGEITTRINPFPILVNGATEDIDAYNINGSTYIKLTDVSNATKGIVNVKFDNENRVINISILDPKMEVENLAEVESINTTTPDGLPVVTFNDEAFISGLDFYNKYGYIVNNAKNFYSIEEKWTPEGNSGNYILVYREQFGGNNSKILLEGIPLVIKGDSLTPNYIPYDYYIENVLPLIVD